MLRFNNYIILLVGVLSVFNLIGCHKNSSRSDTGPVKNNLIFTRSDGTQVVFSSRTSVWCGQWEEGLIPTNTLNVLVGFAVWIIGIIP